MNKTERFARNILTVLAILSAVAVVIQIIDETGPLTAAYAILTFSVSIIALTLAVLQGINNAKTASEIKELVKDLKDLQKEEKAELKNEAKLSEKLDEEIALTKKVTSFLTKK